MASYRIGIWGGPRCGKSTFLSALRVSMMRERSFGNLTIDGKNVGSSLFLADATKSILHGDFPPETSPSAPVEYQFTVSGELPPEGIGTLLNKGRTFDLSLIVRDFAGGKYLTRAINDGLWEYLGLCQGLVYLYDKPDGETEENRNFDYLQLALDFLKTKFANHLIDGRYLPVYISVCLSKFDHPSVFEPLRSKGLIQRFDDPRGTPFVVDGEAAFKELADDLSVTALQTYFHPSMVSYHVTSSIGFYAPAVNAKINWERRNGTAPDYTNVVETKDGPRIRSGFNTVPVNVVRPIVWLQDKFSRMAVMSNKR